MDLAIDGVVLGYLPTVITLAALDAGGPCLVLSPIGTLVRL